MSDSPEDTASSPEPTKKPAKKAARKSTKKAAKKAPKSGVRNARVKTAEKSSPDSPELPLNTSSQEKPKSDKKNQNGSSEAKKVKAEDNSTSPQPSDENKDQPRGGRTRNGNRRSGGKNKRNSPPPVEIDEKTVAKKAWKIFQGEVVEEGLALIDDREAREKALRAFKVAEIFVIEQERRKKKDTSDNPSKES